ncbi:MAG: hypothetical protein ACFB5Z_15300 [Elainellaceae cyanobacterium]
MDAPGLRVSKPIAVWNKPLKANFKDLFKALGKGGVDAATGQWGGLAKDLVDASVAVGLGNDAEQVAWLLIYRALAQAMEELIGDSKDLMVIEPEDVDGVCDCLPQFLSDRYGYSLEQAQKIVDEARQKKWD